MYVVYTNEVIEKAGLPSRVGLVAVKKEVIGPHGKPRLMTYWTRPEYEAARERSRAKREKSEAERAWMGVSTKPKSDYERYSAGMEAEEAHEEKKKAASKKILEELAESKKEYKEYSRVHIIGTGMLGWVRGIKDDPKNPGHKVYKVETERRGPPGADRNLIDVTEKEIEPALEALKHTIPEPPQHVPKKTGIKAGEVELLDIQADALDYVWDESKPRLDRIAKLTQQDKERVEAWYNRLNDFIKTREIAINRWLAPKTASWNNVMDTGVLKNQFQTGTSSGSLDPVKNGDRDRWERDLFGGRYQSTSNYRKLVSEEPLPKEEAELRPQYGWVFSLFDKNVHRQYGKVSFVLKDEARNRCTFTLGNSSGVHTLREQAGTFKECSESLLIAILYGSWAASKDPKDIKDADLEKILLDSHDYVETQIHGGVDLARDVKEVRVWGTIEPHIKLMADAFGLEIKQVEAKEWSKSQE